MGGVIEEGRNAVQGLRVSKEGTKDLEQAFSRIPQELAIRDAADFRLVVEGTPRVLHPIIRDEIYRIGREAVTNAFRHAVAKTIDLSMEYGADELRVAVRDDGCGIDSKVLQSGRDGHWGLAGMRERAERIGGTVKLWSSAGNGTEVELRVPGRIAFESSALNGRSKWLPKSRARKEPESPREERAV
jgi:signal transduction histidine kinase